jgi:hypothetical protein
LNPSEGKHRNAVFQRVCAEITREIRDLGSLRAATQRALNDHDVRGDPELLNMIRSFAAEREAEVRAQEQRQPRATVSIAPSFVQPRRPAPGGAPAAPTPPAPPAAASPPARGEILRALAGALHAFEDAMTHFDMLESRRELDEIRALGRKYPDYVESTVVARSEARFARVREQFEHWQTEIEKTVTAAIAAGRAGNDAEAGKALRRLQAINAMRPALLSNERFVELRTQIQRSAEEHDRSEASADLLRRERAVAAELKHVAHEIRQFHMAAHKFAHDAPEYQKAAAEYASAVRELRTLDREWFAALILELETLIEEMHDPAAQVQVDQFLNRVRSALSHLRHEVDQIESERSRAVRPG